MIPGIDNAGAHMFTFRGGLVGIRRLSNVDGQFSLGPVRIGVSPRKPGGVGHVEEYINTMDAVGGVHKSSGREHSLQRGGDSAT